MVFAFAMLFLTEHHPRRRAGALSAALVVLLWIAFGLRELLPQFPGVALASVVTIAGARWVDRRWPHATR